MIYNRENTVVVGNPLKVFLDGVEHHDVVECDPEEGYLIQYVTDEEDKLVVEDREILTRRLEGVVTVEPIES